MPWMTQTRRETRIRAAQINLEERETTAQSRVSPYAAGEETSEEEETHRKIAVAVPNRSSSLNPIVSLRSLISPSLVRSACRSVEAKWWALAEGACSESEGC